jgi:hypothetical protein
MSDFQFPQFRKYSNNGSYFKILSQNLMHEKKALGKQYLFFEIDAQTYYEKYQIKDLLECSFENVQIIDEQEYKLIPSKI